MESYRSDLIKEHAQGVSDYQVACEALAPYVDAFLAETMSCVEESAQVLEAVSDLDRCLPMLVSYTLDPKGNFRDNEAVTHGLRRLLDLVKEENVECKHEIME
jgi:S-methylmethionine-dependent homocysteine/selenocysteine methylase